MLETKTIRAILTQYPQTKAVFEAYGLYIYGQSETARHENLKASCLVNGIKLDAVVKALAEAVQGS